MSSCSSTSSQYSIQQLLQKATSPTPQQSVNKLQTQLQDGTKPETQQSLNTSGDRGTKVNVSA